LVGYGPHVRGRYRHVNDLELEVDRHY